MSILVLTAFAMLPLQAACAATASDGFETQSPQGTAAHALRLEKVVELSRHGVRPWLEDSGIEKSTGRQWGTQWLVSPGRLTGHGYADAVMMGRWLRRRWVAEGYKLPRCGSGTVYAVTDGQQRTRATGKALLDGMFPGCGIVPAHTKVGPGNFLFAGAADGKPDFTTWKRQAIEALGGTPTSLKTRYKTKFRQLVELVCGANSQCPLARAQWAFHTTASSLSIPAISGASAVAQSLRLAYDDNQPLSGIIAGQAVSNDSIRSAMDFLSLESDLQWFLPYIAQRNGSELMSFLALNIRLPRDGSRTGIVENDAALQDKRLVIVVGHDSNVANMAGMLGLHWSPAGISHDTVPPVATLLLKRFVDPSTNTRYGQLQIILQRAKGIRHLRISQNGKFAPAIMTYSFGTGCFTSKFGKVCKLDSFVEALQRSIAKRYTRPIQAPSMINSGQ